MKIVLESQIVDDVYTQYLYDHYDIQLRQKVVTEVPMLNCKELRSFDWNIGLLVGESGSGKSTILRQLGEVREPVYDYGKCVVSQFPQLSPAEVEELLHGVGLASIPTHLKRVNELSNGQRARLDIAWQLANAVDGKVLIDEWTSVVDRPTAKSLSFSIQRYIRKHGLKVIFASCHYDIIEDEGRNHWLQPDWIYNLNLRDESGDCEIERLVYSDDPDYSVFKAVSADDVLTDRMEVR